MRDVVFILLSLYQKTISPNHGLFTYFRYRCRFFPSCSVYGGEAISRYGLLRGSVISFARIIRCGPWSAGGHDPVRATKYKKVQKQEN